MVLLHETTLDLVDEIVDLFNRALKKTDSRSRRELEAWRVATAQATSEKVRLFSRLGRLVLDPDIPDEQLRRRSFEEVASRELFAAAVEETEPLLRPRDGSYLDFVENRYGPLRKFAPLVLRVLDFKSLKTDDPLIDAVEILRELNRKRRRRVPEDAGLEFASAKWRGQLWGSDGRVNRRFFELCVLYPLRDGLRSGAIWFQGSRRFADPATYLIPSSQWTSRRSEVLRILGLERFLVVFRAPSHACVGHVAVRLDLHPRSFSFGGLSFNRTPAELTFDADPTAVLVLPSRDRSPTVRATPLGLRRPRWSDAMIIRRAIIEVPPIVEIYDLLWFVIPGGHGPLTSFMRFALFSWYKNSRSGRGTAVLTQGSSATLRWLFDPSLTFRPNFQVRLPSVSAAARGAFSEPSRRDK